MAKQSINIGTSANDRTGDSLRSAFNKINENFTDLYTALGLDEGGLNLGAFEFTGSTLTTTDSSAITVAQQLNVTSDLIMSGDVVPNTDNVYDLGSADKQWRSLYVSSDTIFIGGISLRIDGEGRLIIGDDSTVLGGAISYNDLTDTPTIPTVPTAVSSFTNDAGYITLADVTGEITVNSTGDLKGSVFADDSTLLVDGVDGKIRGDIENATVNITSTVGDVIITAEDDIDLETLGSGGDIRITAGDDVTITTNNADGGPAYDWFFSSGGFLSFPDEADLNFYSTVDGVTFSTAYDPVARPSARLTVDTDSSRADLLLHNETVDGHINLETNAGIWTFGADGNLDAPGGISLDGTLTVEESYSSTPTTKFFEIETGAGNNRILRTGVNMSNFSQSAGPQIDLTSYRSSPQDGDAGPGFVLRASTLTSVNDVIATIGTEVTDVSAGDVTSKIVFTVQNNGSNVTPLTITGTTVDMQTADQVSISNENGAVDIYGEVEFNNGTTSFQAGNSVTFNTSVDFNGVVNFDDATIDWAPIVSDAIQNNGLPVGTRFTHPVPATSEGASGDVQGAVTFDSNYIYYCTATYSEVAWANTATIDIAGGNGVDSGIAVTLDVAPSVGWSISDGTTTSTINQVVPQATWYVIFWDDPITFDIGDTVYYGATAPSQPDIWKRVAWSGDTW